MSDLFVEIFPLEPAALPTLVAYRLVISAETAQDRINQVGRRVVRHFSRSFPGTWLWIDGQIVTDTEYSSIELSITLDILKSEKPTAYKFLDGIEAIVDWRVTPEIIADFIIRGPLRALDAQFETALAKMGGGLRDMQLEREHKLAAWSVEDQPAVSISIASRLLYQPSVMAYAGGERDSTVLSERLTGLGVVDQHRGIRGEIIRVAGHLADYRSKLLDAAQSPAERSRLENALDGEWVLAVRAGGKETLQIASALQLMVRLADVHRFDVDAALVTRTLQMTPAVRAEHVRAVSDVAKSAGLLANAYNSRAFPDAFIAADFETNLRFSANRVRPYDAGKVAYDFAESGVYKLRERFMHKPVRVCVVNALPLKIEDFVEALQRQLDRNFDFSIDVIRERRVRVVSQANLESAVRVVEKEDPDLILTFIPDDPADDAQLVTAGFIKGLTLGRGLPNHIISETMLNDPEAMPAIIMAILGKTGSSPFVLAEPLEGIDDVIGLDVVRDYQKTTEETRLTAIARIYHADGEFSGFTVRDMVLEDDTLPYVLMRDLFPQKRFAGRRVIIHHDGAFALDLLTALNGWAAAIKATFYLVEIMRFGAPRIYAISPEKVRGRAAIVQPPWGSAFKLNEHEALLISSLPTGDITPQPLHIRIVGATPLPLEKVLRSVLVWTLLAYGAERLPKLPVTAINAGDLARWLGKGGRFNAMEGDVPFWL